MHSKLVLFDIDGTLLKVGNINRHILIDALKQVYGTEGSAAHHDFSGKMDSTIIYEVLEDTGLSAHEIAGKFDEAKKTYIELFRQKAKPADIMLMKGIRELLSELSRRDEILMGLLTGNFEESGRHKLKLPSIDHYFSFGAFADDAFNRNDLPAIAASRARRIAGKNFSSSEIVIIGDTEHDIRCARMFNAKSIAVATGNFSMQELMAHDPGALFENLSGTDAVIREILTP
jgi:phosphoglycolate phosphatase-like HAD superfamily hydrolase